jgi:hypothetical protein
VKQVSWIVPVVLMSASVARADADKDEYAYFDNRGLGRQILMQDKVDPNTLVGDGPTFMFKRSGVWYVVNDPALVEKAHQASNLNAAERAAKLADKIRLLQAKFNDTTTNEDRQALAAKLGEANLALQKTMLEMSQKNTKSASGGHDDDAQAAIADEALKSGKAEKLATTP